MSLSPPKPFTQAQCVARWWPAAIVFLQFIVYSAIQSPVPAVNEPHYLGKAKHFWNPDWAAGDFFLESSNPHLVFYMAFGWLTRLVSLEATAWIARLVGYGTLAIGWTLLARRFAGSRTAAIPSTATFLLLASIGNLSGEWLVGGIEGKVLSYALLFAGIPFVVERRLNLAAICLGSAFSFHPVVGAWGIICVAIAEACLAPWRLSSKPAGDDRSGHVLPLAILIVAALPGLIPALLSLGGAPAAESARANYIQVFIRLRHHLDPMRFGIENYLGYLAMFAAWLFILVISCRATATSPTEQGGSRCRYEQLWFVAFVFSAVVIALAGVAIGWHSGSAWNMPLRNIRTTLLKFYPFRLADVLVPLALSLAISRMLLTGSRRSPRGAILVAITTAAFLAAISIPQPSRNPSRMTPERFAAWTDAARWIRESTPQDSLLVTPTRQWGFRWFSGRSLYVNYKDAPQDTAGLLEWERRLELVRAWWHASPTGYFTQSDLKRLGEKTNANYLVTLASPLRFSADPLYDNGIYRIYPLR